MTHAGRDVSPLKRGAAPSRPARLARFAFEDPHGTVAADAHTDTLARDAKRHQKTPDLLRKALSPQTSWVENALRVEKKAGTHPFLASLRVAMRALDECAPVARKDSGVRKLRLLAAIGAAHDGLLASVQNALGEDVAVREACRLVRASLDDAQPWLIQDAALRFLAACLDTWSAAPAKAAALPQSVWDTGDLEVFASLATQLFRTPSASPWLRESAALVLARVRPEVFLKAVQDLLGSPTLGDEIFLRARLLKASPAWSSLVEPGAVQRLIHVASHDPSELVRLEAVEVAVTWGRDDLLTSFVTHESSPRVRTRVAHALARAGQASHLLDVLPALLRDGEASVRFAALDALATLLRQSLLRGDEGVCAVLRNGLSEHTTETSELRRLFESLPQGNAFKGALARRWHVVNLALSLLELPRAASAFAALAECALSLAPGRTRVLPAHVCAPFSGSGTLARALTLLAVDDFGFELSPLSRSARGTTSESESGRRWLLTRGHVFGLRLWRFLHEFRTPSCDKRQGFPHTVGRIFGGRIHIPSQILCELAQTRVPGEPLYLPEDDGWRPAVPLPDEFLSCVFSREPLEIVTPEGVTVVRPPRGVRARAAAYLSLSFGFARFAALRNWTEAHAFPPNAYVSAARAMGFEVSFLPSTRGATPSAASAASAPIAPFFRHESAPAARLDARETPPGGLKIATLSLTDPVTAASAVVAGAASLTSGFGAFRRFVADANANTLGELLLFLCALSLVFVGSHVWRHVQFRRARLALPLVIGGWGTRGKSGTERLKAALFSSMGLGVVSKTTGCEATLLMAAPFGPLREIPLYRPYEKATVWEQQNVVSFAASCGVNVFLWECMGLTPEYVRILQRSWMKDDVSTLTNTYPDHEDLQGPAGVNIPQVMTNFVPSASILCTTEEQMLPILREEARRTGTALRAAGWREAGQIPPEVLALFPYEEHPYNVALVLEVARVCGVDSLFALKAMSDAVVPDIGVLKTYPPVKAAFGRSLAFSNGCSANERHGCTGNWMRLGFHAHDPDAESGVWVSTFVNNRADRTARSQVFGRVLVFDTAVDRHVLVGTNVTGLIGYYEEALEDYVEGVALWSFDADAAHDVDACRALARDRLRRHFRHVRHATTGAGVRRELEVLLRALGVSNEDTQRLSGVWMTPEAIEEGLLEAFGPNAAPAAPAREKALAHLRKRVAQWRAFQDFSEAIAGVPAPDSPQAAHVDTQAKAYLRDAFRAKLVVLPEGVQSDGDALMEALLEGLPPGFHERLMGVQNIKGPGLTLLYRLERMAQLREALAAVRAGGPRAEVHAAGLRLQSLLSDVPSFLHGEVASEVAALRAQGLLEGLSDAGLSDARLSVPARTGKSAEASRKVGETASPWRLWRGVGEFFEPLAAIRRRLRADRVYRELGEGVLTPEEAASRLRVLIDER